MCSWCYFNMCRWACCKEWQEVLHACRDRLQHQAVAVVTGKKPAGFVACPVQYRVDIMTEIFIVHVQHIVRRPVHTLQEAVAAVIQTVQHVGKIIVVTSANTIACGCFQYAAVMLVCQYQGGLALLQPEVLRFRVEYLAIALAPHPCCLRKARADVPGAGVVCYLFFYIYSSEHGQTGLAVSVSKCRSRQCLELMYLFLF